MSLLFRGFVWFGVYVMLALLPLIMAAWTDGVDLTRPATVEIGSALGLIAFAVIMMQFALVSRLRSMSRPFGTDALMQFHQQMGVLALLLAAAHPLLLNVPLMAWVPLAGISVTRTGATAFWTVFVIITTSLFRRRLRLSYETWQAVHLAAAILIVASMLAHALAAGAYARAPALRALLVAYAGAFMTLTAWYRLLRPLLIWRRPWEITMNRDERASTRTIRLKPIGHAGFEFEPGQFAWLITGRTPFWSQQHPISISSSAERPLDGAIEFSIKALGDWSTTVVPALQPGQRLWVDGPFGAFTPDRTPSQGFVLIAGGIGIAPMRAILLTMRDRGDRRHVLLFQAAHDEARLLFADELESLRRALNLDVITVLEEPLAAWLGERGLLTRNLLARRLPRQYRRYAFFVCGPVPMMDAMEHMLLSLGVPARSIQTERFDMI